MEYVNVSQFYQSVLCFSIPLLFIQRVILFCFDLSSKYEDYRRTFYEDEFKFIKEFEYHAEEPYNMPAQSTLKNEMLDKKEEPRKSQDLRSQLNEGNEINRPEQSIRSRISSIYKQQQPSNVYSPNKQEPSKTQEQSQFKKTNKIEFNLQTDKQLKNDQIPNINIDQIAISQSEKAKMSQKVGEGEKQQIKSQPEEDKSKTVEQQKPVKAQTSPEQPLSPSQRMSKVTETCKQGEREEEPRLSKITQSDIDYSRETDLGRDSYAIEKKQNVSQFNNSEKVVIELGKGQLLERGEMDRIKLRYCRRVDDAFNDYVPIILSVIVLGILTQSVYIYSMCCFFGYAFSSLLFNYVHLLDRLEGAERNNKSFFGRANQLISSLFIIGLFISYWVSDQFY